VRAPLKLREALKRPLLFSKSKIRAVDVADNEEGVQVRVPPVSEPRLKISDGGPRGLKRWVVIARSHLWMLSGWSAPMEPSVVMEPVATSTILPCPHSTMSTL
jgi:hypothetical protein